MQKEARTPGLQFARSMGNQRRLHSIHGLLHGRVVEGQVEVQEQTYRFKFAPAAAALPYGQFVLTGRLTVHSPQLVAHAVDDVDARLVAIQGGVGVTPPRRQLVTGTQTGETSTSDQRMEQEKGPETDLQPGLHPFETPRLDESGRPVVESSESLGFVGVIYFILSKLDGPALGVPLDLSQVQLNLRLAPTDDLARDLQEIFSDLTDALYSEKRDERTAMAQVAELNRLFKS